MLSAAKTEWLLLILISLAAAAGQAQTGPAEAQNSGGDEPITVFRHNWDRIWISAQINLIEQMHPAFHSPYTGPNSLRPTAEHAGSRVLTLYTGLVPKKGTELLLDVESTGGRGISDALGLAGFTNLDVVRNPDLGPKPYIARVMLRHVIRLGGDAERADRSYLGIEPELPAKRLEFRLGKMSLADFFDVNSIASDSHLQFLNWAVDNNGAWDYAADTRGYTYAAVAELHVPAWSLRFAEALMPKVANGIDLQWNLRRARGSNLEFELRPTLLRDRKTTLRLLGYRNVADTGNYRQAINAFLAHQTAAPAIIASRAPGRTKNGIGFNAEQELTSDLRLCARLGWNDGRNESFAYTEVDRTASFGGDLSGERWRRKNDKLGAIFVVNAISADHREYLALGGLGFLLGDGRLDYGHEKIFEAYYTAHAWRGVFASFDLQHINNPGYNRDRGAVWVPSLRVHVDF